MFTVECVARRAGGSVIMADNSDNKICDKNVNNERKIGRAIRLPMWRGEEQEGKLSSPARFVQADFDF
jgi:hypothetical protein